MTLRWLFKKDLRELAASRAYWLLFLMLGPLVGHAFIAAVQSYAEKSGGSGAVGFTHGLNPLDGILAPTFAAYEPAVMLLLPFAAVRLLSAEKESGALTLLLQAPPSAGAMLGMKALVLLIGWIVAWIPGLIALALWNGYGGHLDAGEVANVLLGLALRGMLTIGVSLAAAALTSGTASATLLALGVTLGGWALDYTGATRGGLAHRLAAYTPEAATRVFEQGELRASTVLAVLAFSLGALAFAAVWLRPALGLRDRALSTVAAIAGTAALAAVCASTVSPRASVDVSESRRNSLPVADESALSAMHTPLRISVYLADDDPRLADLEREVLRKLERTMPDIAIHYAAKRRSGLFGQTDSLYGQVWYTLGDRRAMSRSTSEPIVLQLIYGLTGLTRPAPDDEPPYPGYPRSTTPSGAAAIFYLAWPLVAVAMWWMVRRGISRTK